MNEFLNTNVFSCYLNALLQFYFSIVPIRDLILGFSIPTTLTEEQTKDEALSRSLSCKSDDSTS